MDDYGILISTPGTNVNTAQGSQILLSTNEPFVKIDTQNDQGFKTITLLITTDPPEPTGPGWVDKYTVLYKYRHGYTYVPTIESLFFVNTPPPGQVSGGYQLYFYDYGLLGISLTGFSGVAELYACADATWVYYIVRKVNSDGVSPVLLSGTNVIITTHVFVEDIGV